MDPTLIRFKRIVTYTVLFSYLFHILTPAAHAMIGEEDERQPLQTKLLKKVRSDVFPDKKQAERTWPTLRIHLKQKGETDVFKLKISETRLDEPPEKNIPAFKWKHEGTLSSFASLGAFEHPWQQYLELKYRKSSGLGITCRPIIEDGQDVFVPYNYIFNTSKNLTLNHLVTPGYIEVGESQRLTTIFVEGQAGVRLQSQKKIQNSYFHRSKPAHIRSNGNVILQAPQLDNMNSIISGKQIFGYFDKQNEEEINGCRSGAIENSHGQIHAEEALQLHGNESINNHWGIMESKSNQGYLSTYGSFKNSRGVVRSYFDLELHAKKSIENGQGLMESRNGGMNLSTLESFDNFSGILKSFRQLDLQVKEKLNNWKGFIDSSREKLTLTAGEISNVHGGQMTCQGLQTLRSSGDIDNFDGLIESRENQVQLTSGGILFNKYGGQVRGKTGLNLRVAEDIKNVIANLWSDGDITLEAKGVEHRGFHSLIDGENIQITAKKTLGINRSTSLKAKRAVTLIAPVIVLGSPLLSRDVFLKASKGLTFEAPQSIEYLDIMAWTGDLPKTESSEYVAE